MAIHPNCPGISVSILSNGTTLREYPTENDEPQHPNLAVQLHHEAWTVTNYIEAKTNQSFSINLAVEYPFEFDSPSIGFNIEVDGKLVDCVLLPEDDYLKDVDGWELDVEGKPVRVGRGLVVREMKFAEINSTSEELGNAIISQHCEIIEDVGTIVVDVHKRTAPGLVNQKRMTVIKDDEEVDFSKEVHLKALVKENQSHGVKLGKAKPLIEPITDYETQVIDQDFPIVTFIFKYRSEKSLKQLYIIPRTPEPTLASIDIHTMPLATAEKLANNLRNQVERLIDGLFGGIQASPLNPNPPRPPPSIRARPTEAPSPSQGMKREADESGNIIMEDREEKRSRIEPTSHTIVIDLTGDDDDDDDDDDGKEILFLN